MRKNKKRIISLALAGIMGFALTGCGGGDDTQGQYAGTGQQDMASAGEQQGDDGGGAVAMGRYVETEIDLSEQATYPLDLCVREDGSLVIIDRFAGVLTSQDQGATWESETPDWLAEMRTRPNSYISSMCMAPDGTVAVLSSEHTDGEVTDVRQIQDGSAAETDVADGAGTEDREEDAAGDAGAEDREEDAAGDAGAEDREEDAADGAGTEDHEEDAAEDAGAQGEPDGGINGFDIQYILTLVLPDGTQVPVDAALTEEEAHFTHAVMTDDNRIFASTLRSVYEVRRDGSVEKIVALEYHPQWLWVRDELLLMDTDWKQPSTPDVYDLDAGEWIPDEVLVEFVAANYDDRHYNGTDYASMFLLPGEEHTVYVVGKRGIHRHVIGGNMMEQIVDGNLSQLINPNYCITDMVQLITGEFLALFSNGKLIRFTYDPDIPSVPEQMLTLYSLKENDIIRQAVSYYQTQHPDVFLSYQVGMGGDSSVTREDALKRLNTQIMAGEGPDLLVMDELPLDAYVEKGMLVDLTDYLQAYSAKEALFDNVTEALMRDGRAYVAPAGISLPKIISAADGVENMTDLSDLGGVIEQLRAAYPTKDILRVSGERGILKRFAAVSAPKWIAADGSLDRDVIGVYLEQCRRIYAAQMDGLNEQDIAYYDQRNMGMEEYYGMRMDEMNCSANLDVMQYVGGEQHMIAGWLEARYVYTELTSLHKTKGLEATKIVPMQGQCSHVFLPNTMLGISAASERTDLAYGFMDVFLSAQTQSSYENETFPYNRVAFDTVFTPPQEEELGENGEYGGIATIDEEGHMVDFIMYWSSDAEIDALREELASVDTAYIPDSVLEDAVFTQGIAYMSGRQSLAETLSAIERSVAIYMAE